MTDYLQWQSRLSLEQVFATVENFSYPTPFNEGCLYLSDLKEEDSRCVLMYRDAQQSQCLTPKPFNLRTKINEYGGKPYWLIGHKLLFVNQSDQQIYQQTFNDGVVTEPVLVSPLKTAYSSVMYADLVGLDFDSGFFIGSGLSNSSGLFNRSGLSDRSRLSNGSGLSNNWILAIAETVGDDSACENIHSIRAFNSQSTQSELVELASGADFYSNLVVSNDAKFAAWVQWNHPAMPWDSTELWVAEIGDNNGQPIFINHHKVDLAAGASVCQLIIANNGVLFFSADFPEADVNAPQNFWNVMCYAFDGASPRAVTSMCQEFAYPHWQYGDARIVQFDDDHLLTFASGISHDEFYLINQQTLAVRPLHSAELSNKTIQNLGSNQHGKAVAVMLAADSRPAMVEIRLDAVDTVISNSMPLKKADISTAEHVEYQTRDNATAYGFYYPAVNSDYQADTAPPLIVMVHGGPTARAYGYFDIQKQFWTSRGFAIFDVNHRGSSGYGRAYRDALYGRWGIIDTSDIIDGVQHLIASNKADANRICIRGKSAGGYAVLRALTEYPQVFKAGACYYGIGNLATLAEVTHKFEKYYTDTLIGEQYDAKTAQSRQSLFYQRSPIHNLDKLKAAMIIFQGLEDKIVPPVVAKEVVSLLTQADIAHSYVEYPDEGHGFRQKKTNIDAWSQELAFYRSVLNNNNDC